MKKFFVRLSVLMLIACCSLVLVSCGGGDENEYALKDHAHGSIVPKTGVGYGLVHGKGYVGIAEVVTLDGYVIGLNFDEVFLPATLAVETTADTIDEVVEGASTRTAKYIKIGDKLFTGVYDADGKKIVYSTEGIADINAWLEASQANCEWYVQQIITRKFVVCTDAAGTADANAAFNKQGSFYKSQSTYWPSTAKAIGWAKNVESFAFGLIGTKLDVVPVKNTTTGFISVGSNVTSATLTDFIDYYNVAKLGYAKAIAK